MTTILLIDTNYTFTADVESRLILNEIPDLSIETRNVVDDVFQTIQNVQPDKILLNAAILEMYPDWNLNIPVLSYARNPEGVALAAQRKIPCYGVINHPEELLTAIESDSFVQITDPKTTPEPVSVPPVQKVQQKTVQQKTKKIQQPVQEEWFEETIETPVAQQNNGFQQSAPVQPRRETVVTQNQTQQTIPNAPQQTPASPAQTIARPQGNTTNQTASSSMQTDAFDLKARLAQAKEEERRLAEQQRAAQEQKDRQILADQLDKKKDKAKVITVYSAKGGVGKTTISCELAVYLALTDHGRGKYKVCIADFNIDFGDVMATLSYDPDKFCMTNWADEIREELEKLPADASGKHTKEQLHSIQYTTTQMDRWLQKNPENGLYALLAPTSNEDSMDITEEELEVMMHNLIYNGGFDFVICDTGNNTRDSSYMSLLEADQVFLVVTQNFNTMNCNNSVLSMLYKVKFDMSKINLIINKVKPKKSVGISMDEVAEALKNPETGRPYPCIARIKDTNDIKQANNNAEPLVYNPSHEFTKSIGQLVSKIVGDNFVLEQPKKQGFFAKLFGKK